MEEALVKYQLGAEVCVVSKWLHLEKWKVLCVVGCQDFCCVDANTGSQVSLLCTFHRIKSTTLDWCWKEKEIGCQ